MQNKEIKAYYGDTLNVYRDGDVVAFDITFGNEPAAAGWIELSPKKAKKFAKELKRLAKKAKKARRG